MTHVERTVTPMGRSGTWGGAKCDTSVVNGQASEFNICDRPLLNDTKIMNGGEKGRAGRSAN